MAAPMSVIVSVAFLVLFYVFSAEANNNVPYVENYFEQYVDHFNFLAHGQTTFKQRVLVQDKWWKKGEGPIFFYTGNEGPIDAFWNNTGFVFDIAPEFGALVIFAEHRFYGKSLPFGTNSFKIPENIGLLTVEQALADYAVLLTSLKKQMNATSLPVIAFGGSYGGMLSAYIRYNYPGIIAGSIASSAPIYLLDPDFPKNFFWKAVTKDFSDVSDLCKGIAENAFDVMNMIISKGGYAEISKMFQLCKDLQSKADFRHLLLWIRNAFGNMAMLDYPYPTDFLEPLPANPVKAACNYLMTEENAIAGLVKAVGLFYNGTNGSLKCFDIFSEYTECADPTGCGVGTDGMAWDFQACTEIRLPDGTDNKTDMFPYLPFTESIREKYCQTRWNVTPRNTWGKVQLINLDLKGASNIVFANGELDPWTGGGVLSSKNPTIKAFQIQGSAHHLDLRGSNPLDPPSVVQARNIHKQNIKMWIDEWNIKVH